jgi:hypothetical protein
MSRDSGRIACGHEGDPFGEAICAHLREGSKPPSVSYVKWYTGTALDAELLCRPCANARRDGAVVAASFLCEPCFRKAIEAAGEPSGARGQPGILVRAEPFETTLRYTVLPREIGAVADLAPIDGLPGSVWLLLTEDGGLTRFDADSLEWTRRAANTVPAEPEREPWNNHPFQRRLHVAARGEFAAVVND